MACISVLLSISPSEYVHTYIYTLDTNQDLIRNVNYITNYLQVDKKIMLVNISDFMSN